jgi:hypothetical protein
MEEAKVGTVETATIKKTPKEKPLDAPAWYWYQSEPTFLSYDGFGVLIARGYNFNSKEEWRRNVTDLNRDELKRLEVPA